VELAGKTVLLTGATGGLGQAIARVMADRKATLVLTSRKREELERLAASLPGDGHRAVPGDLAVEGDAERICAEAGEVDVLVANAGLSAGGRLDRVGEQELIDAVRVNLEAPMRMARALLPGQLERGRGHLVFVSSLQGKIAFARSTVYTATKFGLRGFALSLRDDLHGTPVSASLVSPGFIRDAGMFAASGQPAPAGLGTSSPEQVAAAVVRAVERDRAEVDAAPLRTRAAAAVGMRTPRLNSLLTRTAAAKVTDEVIAAREARQ
jgi:short-subunit dehydrogenase